VYSVPKWSNYVVVQVPIPFLKTLKHFIIRFSLYFSIFFPVWHGLARVRTRQSIQMIYTFQTWLSSRLSSSQLRLAWHVCSGRRGVKDLMYLTDRLRPSVIFYGRRDGVVWSANNMSQSRAEMAWAMTGRSTGLGIIDI